MNLARTDFAVDLAYGVLIFVAIGLIIVAGTDVGVAFGLGALVAYVIHIAWKMSQFDPDWMTREVTEQVTEEVSEEIEETVSQQIEETVGKDVDEMVEKLEQIEERTARASDDGDEEEPPEDDTSD